MFCKVYYASGFKNGRTSAETIENFVGCKITDDYRGIVFTFGEASNPQQIERALSDIEDIKIVNTKPMIF